MNRKINLLYVTSSLDSIHEFRFLKFLSEADRINLRVATNTAAQCHDAIKALNLRIEQPAPAFRTVRKGVLGSLTRKLNNVAFYWTVSRSIRRYGIDVVHSGWLTLDSYIATRTGFHPVLAMSWGSDVLDNPYAENAHHSPRLRKRLTYVATHADLIYSDANHVASTIVELTGIARDKTRVFPQLGIDIGRFKPDPVQGQALRRKYALDGKRVLLMTRQLKHVYGVEDFLRALPAVARQFPDVAVLLAGSGPLETPLRQVARELGLVDTVHFVGAIPNAELPAFYNAADLYVSTSLSDGTSLSLLEAMSSGLPCVVTDVPAVLEWVVHGVNGFVAERGKSESIASALTAAFSASDLQAMGAANRRVAEEKIDINMNFARLLAVYEELLRQRSGS